MPPSPTCCSGGRTWNQTQNEFQVTVKAIRWFWCCNSVVQLNNARCGTPSDISSAGWKLVESISQSLKHILFLQVDSTFLMKQHRDERAQHIRERGWLKLRWSKKNGGFSDSNVFFSCLPVFHKFQTQYDGSEEKQFIFALKSLTLSSCKTPFYLSQQGKTEATAFRLDLE